MAKQIGYNFIYGNFYSERYGLILSSKDADKNDSIGGNVEYKLLDSVNGETPKIVGLEMDNTFSFDIEIYPYDRVAFKDYQDPLIEHFDKFIREKLFNNREPKWLTILNKSNIDYHYKCYLNNVKEIRYAGILKGYEATVNVLHPYPYSGIIKKSYMFDDQNFKINNIEIYCNTSSPFGIMPELEIELLNGNTMLTIQNNKNLDSIFKISGVRPNSTIKVREDQIVEVQKEGLKEIVYGEKFNMQYIKLYAGYNNITINGNCNIKFTYREFINL